GLPHHHLADDTARHAGERQADRDGPARAAGQAAAAGLDRAFRLRLRGPGAGPPGGLERGGFKVVPYHEPWKRRSGPRRIASTSNWGRRNWTARLRAKLPQRTWPSGRPADGADSALPLTSRIAFSRM